MRIVALKGIFSILLLSVVRWSAISVTADGRSTPYRDMISVSSNNGNVDTVLHTEERYLVILASFGMDLYNSTVVNIMLPPRMSSATMCTYPDPYSLQSIMSELDSKDPSNKVYYDPTVPVALLVKRGDCFVEQKARVLLQIAQTLNLTNTLKWLLVYDHDPSTDGELTQFRHVDDVVPPPTDLDGIGIATVPYRYSHRLLQRIATVANISKADPFFLQNEQTNETFTNDSSTRSSSLVGLGSFPLGNNRQWQLLYRISSKDEQSQEFNKFFTRTGTDSIALFRFILFAILLTSPCIRLGYLWYAGGGRILLRRNLTTGRITGLQYIPPIPWWLTGGRIGPNQLIFLNGQQPNGTNPNNPLLTEEQFNALPIIVYEKLSKLDDNDDVTDDEESDEGEDQYENIAKSKEGIHVEIPHLNTYDDKDTNNISSPPTTASSVLTEAIDEKFDSASGDAINQNTTQENRVDDACQQNKSSDDEEKQLKETVASVMASNPKDSKVVTEQKYAENDAANIIIEKQPDVLQFSQNQRHPVIPETNDIDTSSTSIHHIDDDDADAGLNPKVDKLEKESDEDQPRNVIDSTSNEPFQEQTSARTCTMCSICLEDFISGEHLVHLPQCKHAFHRACIRPWLLERNGCCPLCKTPVLSIADSTTDDDVTVTVSGIGNNDTILSSTIDNPSSTTSSLISQPVTTNNDNSVLDSSAINITTPTGTVAETTIVGVITTSSDNTTVQRPRGRIFSWFR